MTHKITLYTVNFMVFFIIKICKLYDVHEVYINSAFKYTV